MPESATLGQFTVRFREFVDLHMRTKVSKHTTAEQCRIAWDNGWRDPAKLAGEALDGTQMANVQNPAALFTAQLQEAAAQTYHHERTPQPPPIAEVVADINRGHQPARDIAKHIQQCRQAINGETA